MQKPNPTYRILTLVALALFVGFLVWAEHGLDPFTVRILAMWGIYVIMIVTFNLIYGYTGQFSLAHAGLAAIGAYTVGVLTLNPAVRQAMYLLAKPIWPLDAIQVPFLPALLLGGVLAAIVGFLIGGPALRLHGDYLLIVTFGFSEIIRLLLVNMPMVVNGAMGLKGIPNNISLLWIWGIVVVTVFITKRLVDSSYGRALKCIRDDEVAAEAMGVGLFYHKMLAFVLSAFFVGIAGGLLSNLLGTIDPNTFRPYLTYAIITMAVLGGVESMTGSILAAGIYTIMSELLRTVEAPATILGWNFPGLPGLRQLAFAVMLLLLILFYRRGLLGTAEFSWRWLLGR
ncbi:MAG TPA: branched-chain amino acid ABC transporter permease, partial [Anaerolineae bacterium]